MNSTMKQMNKEEVVAANFKFLALFANSAIYTDCAVHITDCASAEIFITRWNNENSEVHSVFNYDLPLIHDDDFCAIEHFDEILNFYNLDGVVEMTYAEYIESVKLEID